MAIFRYFPGFPIGARLGAEVCDFCGRSPTIPAVWLATVDGQPPAAPACAECLRAGRVRVRVPGWIERDLGRAILAMHPDWTEEQRAEFVSERMAELAKTPPVPWLQNNEWPVCGDDFASYAGEVTRENLLREYGDADHAQAALRQIMLDARPEWDLAADALDTAWEQLGNFVAIFTFACANRTMPLYVLQTA